MQAEWLCKGMKYVLLEFDRRVTETGNCLDVCVTYINLVADNLPWFPMEMVYYIKMMQPFHCAYET